MKKSKFFTIASIILSIALIVLAGLFMFKVKNLNMLPMNLFVLVSIIASLLIAILLLTMNMAAKKPFSRFLSSLLVLICCGVFAVGNLYISQTTQFIDTVTDNSGKVKNTVSMIVLKDSKVEEASDLNKKTVGRLNSIDTSGTKRMLKDLKESDISVKTKKYGAITDQVSALYDKEVQAIILNESYRHNVEDFEQFKDFSEQTKVVHSVVFYTEKHNEANAVSDVTEKPFTIFISGNDSYGGIDELTRSDVNMLVTVNPKTSTVLLTSIPRDYYVPLVCSDGACAEGALDKLTHTGMHGINTTKETLEDLLDIEINYTFRVNFSSAEQIVDALGGIDITVEPGLEIESFGADGALGGLEAGTHHLDGAHALAFARERYAYEDGDVQRVKNQQQVLEAIVHKAISSDTLVNYPTLLKSMEGAFETNMSQDEIAALVQFQLKNNPEWKFENYVLNGEGQNMFCAEVGTGASVLVPDQRTIDIAHKKILAVMKGKSSDTIESELDDAVVYPDYMAGVEPVPVVEEEQPVEVPVDSGEVYYDPYAVQQPVETPTDYVDPNVYSSQEPVIPQETVQAPIVGE